MKSGQNIRYKGNLDFVQVASTSNGPARRQRSITRYTRSLWGIWINLTSALHLNFKIFWHFSNHLYPQKWWFRTNCLSESLRRIESKHFESMEFKTKPGKTPRSDATLYFASNIFDSNVKKARKAQIS